LKHRPGKPFFFGSKNNVMVFAFPGNPISVLHCASRYLLPHLRNQSIVNVRCISTYTNSSELTVYVPAFISTNEVGNIIASIVRQNGSGDYMGALGANGFMEVLPNTEVKENDVLSFYKF
jgi:molybdopterin molybdotransferase